MRSIEIAKNLGPSALARCLAYRGQCLIQYGNKAEARRDLEQARALFETVGVQSNLDFVDSLLSEC